MKTTLSKLTRYEQEYYRGWYAPLYEEAVHALKAACPEIKHWAACQVPRRWAQQLVRERDEQVLFSEHPILKVARTMESGRIVACPSDDNFVIVGLEKPHADSTFCMDPDFFGACIWHPL